MDRGPGQGGAKSDAPRTDHDPDGARRDDAAAPTAIATATAGTTTSGTSWQSIAALILAGFAVVLSVLAVWLGRPRYPDQPGPETSSGAAR